MHFMQAADTVTNGPLSGDYFSKDQEDSYHGNKHILNPLNEQEGACVLYALAVSHLKGQNL